MFAIFCVLLCARYWALIKSPLVNRQIVCTMPDVDHTHAVANNCGNFLVGESEGGVDGALSIRRPE
jgi:hypothetical protein